MGRHARTNDQSGNRFKRVLKAGSAFGLAGISASIAGKAMEYETLQEAGEYFAVGAPIAVVAASAVTKVGEKVGIPPRVARVATALATAGWMSYQGIEMYQQGDLSAAEATGVAGVNAGGFAAMVAMKNEVAAPEPAPQTPDIPPIPPQSPGNYPHQL